MKLRIYTADTYNEAMEMVRRELGPDAIIVSGHLEDGRHRITAALEQDSEPSPAPEPEPASPSATGDTVRQALAYHGVPDDLADALAGHAGVMDMGDPAIALSAAIDNRFQFKPLSDRRMARPIFLVGPPGSGKTTTAAKLATRARLSGDIASVVTIDGVRPAAYEQLSAVTSLLGARLESADSPVALREALDECEADTRIVVDSAGANPFDTVALDRLSAFVAMARAEPVLVLPAGMDALEAAETADAFRSLAPSRLIVTRIDMTRRLGSVLSAAEAGGLALADAGTSPRVVDRLSPLNPVALSRLLLRDPTHLDEVQTLRDATA